MENWELFFEEHKNCFIKTDIMFDGAEYGFNIDQLYQNFKQRMIDESIEETKIMTKKDLKNLKSRITIVGKILDPSGNKLK